MEYTLGITAQHRNLRVCTLGGPKNRDGRNNMQLKKGKWEWRNIRLRLRRRCRDGDRGGIEKSSFLSCWLVSV